MGVYLWVDQQQRQPWANTVAYRPLNSTTTVSDQSGNNHTLTQTWGSFGTYNWVDCFYNGGSSLGYLELETAPNIPSGNADRTISFWAYPTSYNRYYDRYFFSYGDFAANGKAVYLVIGSNWKMMADVLGGAIFSTNTMSTSGWSLLTFTTSWNTFSVYENGELVWSNSSITINTRAVASPYSLRLMEWRDSTSLNYQVQWYLSEVIIENKTRTATEISNYYNITKSKYWL